MHEAAGEHRLRLGAERELAGPLGVDDRLHAERVTHDEQLAEPAVEEREAEDAVEPGDEPDALVLVEVGEDLGVAASCAACAPARAPAGAARGSCRSRRCRRRRRSRPRSSSAASRRATSWIASRRFPRHTPSPTKKPSPSGPRWMIVLVIARIRPASPNPYVPAIPHIRLDPRTKITGLREGGLEVVDHPLRDVDLVVEQPLAGQLHRAHVVSSASELLDGRDRAGRTGRR